MSFLNDEQAFCLANTYAFNPPRKIGPARLRIQNTGKYEPDRNPTAATRTMVLASWVDKTNILLEYDPLLNIVASYHVEGTLTPNAADNYSPDGETNEVAAYASPLRAFLLYWDGTDSWLIKEQWATPYSPYWKRTAPGIIGDYAPQNGATGTATVVAGPE